MLGGSFWIGASLIYLGFLLVAIDLWVEPDLHGKTGMRIVGVLAIALFAAAFSWRIVFVKAPLDVMAFTINGTHPPGTTIAGIAWKAQFTELQVWLVNPTERNYDDLNVVIRPGSPIAAIAQLTAIPNVSFEDSHAATGRLISNATVIPLILLATDTGYRMRCPRLPAKTEIKVVIALADVKWNPLPPEDKQQASDKNYVLRVKREDDCSTYWFGHAGVDDDYTPRPTSSETIKIEGEYVAAQRTRSVSQKIKVGGNLANQAAVK